MDRMSLAYAEHRLRNSKQWAEDVIKYFADNFNISAEQLQRISKVEQGLYRWDSLSVQNQNTVTLFQDFVAANAGMPTSSFDPPTDEHMAVVGIALYEGVEPVVSETDWTYGISDQFLKQGSLQILVNGEVQLSKVPLTQFVPNLTTRELGFLPLKSWIPWQGDTQLNVRLSWPAAISASNQNVRCELIGIGFGA